MTSVNIHSVPLVICTSWQKALLYGIGEMSSFSLYSVFMQALREPAIFAKAKGSTSDPPPEKLTLAQARRGTPGTHVHLLPADRGGRVV